MKNVILFVALVLGLAGCVRGDSDQICRYDPCSQVAPASEIQAVKDYLTANNITATQHCSGVFYAVDAPGTAQKPTACNTVGVYYEGRLTDGTVFDGTRPGAPATFQLSGLVPGFINGVLQIGSGGKVRIYIPPSLGYGAAGQGTTIPGNAILIFTVELL